MEQAEFRARVRRIETLLESLESVRDASARATTLELVRAIRDVHAAGLERILEIAGAADSSFDKALAKDDLVASLLLLHGLHPAPMEERVSNALERMEPFLRRRGASARVLSIEGGVVRIRVEGGSPMAADALREALEESVYAMAPEAAEILVESASQAPTGFVPLSALVAR
jgi:hypothetical protein